MDSIKSDPLGQRLIRVLERAWSSPFTTKSDFAKAEADWVAIAASLGFITTYQPSGRFGRIWRVTPRGASFLFTEKR